MPGKRPWLAACAAAALAFTAARFWQRHNAEDFVYYYCAGRLTLSGVTPYDEAPYQACVAEKLGGTNPHVARETSWPYFPGSPAFFALFAALPYGASFAAWNLFLAASSVLLAFSLSDEPWAWLALALWPGFIMAWGYHKVMIALSALFFAGMRRIERGQERSGGALVGLLIMQPQWLAAGALFLLLHKRWKALQGAAAGAAFLLAGLAGGSLVRWFSSAAYHADRMIFLDNQSLFVALAKSVSWLHDMGPERLAPLRWTLSVLLTAAAALHCRRKPPAESLPGFLALFALGLPYSHGSETIWVFPLFLSLLSARANGPAVALCVCAALAVLLGGYPVWALSASPLQFKIGYLTAGVVSVWLVERLARAR